jgi:hypothetical protein
MEDFYALALLYVVGAVSSMSNWTEIIEKKKELTPDELLEVFNRYANADPGALLAFVLEFLEPYMAKAILATNADPITKAQTIHLFGHLIGSYRALYLIYSQYPKESSFKEDLKNIVLTAQKVAKKVVDLYADLKEGKPLELIIYWLVFSILDLESCIESCLAHLRLYIYDKLKPS